MPSGEIDVTPGYTFTEDEAVTLAKLNLLATPTLRMAEGSVTARELAPEAFRSENFPDGEIAIAKLDASGADEADVIRVRSGVCVFEAVTEAMLVGGGILWFSDDAPDGWFIPKGDNISRADNPVLFARWGTFYGEGDGSTTFGTPDLRLRFPRMTDFSTVAVGDTGGEDSHAITEAEMRAHTHPITGLKYDGINSAQEKKFAAFNLAGEATEGGNGAWGVDGGVSTRNTGSAGSSTPMSLLPQYFVVNILVKRG